MSSILTIILAVLAACLAYANITGAAVISWWWIAFIFPGLPILYFLVFLICGAALGGFILSRTRRRSSHRSRPTQD